ncbi:hypothetical protein MTR_5g013595 [Medicago truncatula]|uniref:Uncharacterized protein n=1 Tax=Medicago truncatula TaxID=3880 RepID=A0A072UEG9_MEDTR|nr:hypothetical protein MTR_5g013595 [Medicago truncatula]
MLPLPSHFRRYARVGREREREFEFVKKTLKIGFGEEEEEDIGFEREGKKKLVMRMKEKGREEVYVVTCERGDGHILNEGQNCHNEKPAFWLQSNGIFANKLRWS